MIPITTMNILLQLCANTQLEMFDENLKQYPFHVTSLTTVIAVRRKQKSFVVFSLESDILILQSS